MQSLLHHIERSHTVTPMPYFLPPIFFGLLLQSIPSPLGGEWPALGVGGGIAMVMFYLYREDRKSSEQRLESTKAETEKRIQSMKEASEARLTELTRNFMSIVQDNTKAITTLSEQLQHTIDDARDPKG